MQTTFDGWILNPMVKDNSVFTHRDMYKKMYVEKFDKILLREAGKINFKLYYDDSKDEYYAHLKIPSEVVPNFYYDVVVQFYTKDNGIRASKSLTDYLVRFYSNDPAFVFTYLRVFKKNDMFIEALSSKAPKEALKKDPVQKNPYEVISYIKSLYFAFLYMKAKNLFSKVMYTTYGEKFNIKKLLPTIRDANIVIEERKIKGEEVEKAKREAKKNNSISQPSTSTYVNGGGIKTSSTKKSNVSKVVNTAKVSSSSNRVKTTKKI